jgi:hypothetical protein
MRFTVKELEVIYSVLRASNQALTTHTLSLVRDVAAVYREKGQDGTIDEERLQERDAELGTTMDFREKVSEILRKIELAGKSGRPVKKRKRSGRKKR